MLYNNASKACNTCSNHAHQIPTHQPKAGIVRSVGDTGRHD